MDCCHIAGVESADEFVEVRTIYNPTIGATGSQMLVKSWDISGKGANRDVSTMSDFPYLNLPIVPVWNFWAHPGDRFNFRYEDATDLNGVLAQDLNNPNPISLFANHFVIHFADWVLDPSYGYSDAAPTLDDLLVVVDSRMDGYSLYFEMGDDDGVAVDEPLVKLDLNNDGDQEDPQIVVPGFVIQKNPPGVQLKVFNTTDY